jgi:hypothetical protein
MEWMPGSSERLSGCPLPGFESAGNDIAINITARRAAATAAIFEIPIANPLRFSYSGQCIDHTAGSRLRQSRPGKLRKNQCVRP